MIPEMIKEMINQELDDLHTAAPAKIESYDSKRMIASITLLFKNKGEKIPPIIEVPVSLIKAGPFIIRPPYKKGDIVVVVFSERSLDYILNETPQDPQCLGKHRIDDAIIIGGLKLDSQQNLPSTNTDDLLILNIEANSKAIMTKTGDIILEGNNIYLGEGASEGVPKGTTLKEWLDSHTHSANGTGSPTLPSPTPSTKVKVV